MITVNVPHIETDEDNDLALARIRELWDAEEGTPEYAELEVLTTLVEAYEQKAYPSRTTPQGQVRLVMDQHGLGQKDLVPIFGTASRVSEFLSGKRALSKDQAVRLHLEYRIPLELLLNVYDLLREDASTGTKKDRPPRKRTTRKAA